MSKTNFNTERAAAVLVDAAYMGDKRAAKKWGITPRTIPNYRKRLETDEAFASLFELKRAAAERDWAEQAPMAIRAAIDFILRAAQEGDAESPEMVHAIAGAMKLAADMYLTKQVLDARLAKPGGPQHPAPGEVATVVHIGAGPTDPGR